MISLPTKKVAENYDQPVDFLSKLPFGVALVSAEVTATVISGTDANPENLVGSPSVDGTIAFIPLTGGVAGVIYKLAVLAVGDDDDDYQLDCVLAVR